MTEDGLAEDTVVCFVGNNKGLKAPGCVKLGPQELGTEPRGFWTQCEEDLLESMRIDR
jgi:hypothetical protein